MKGCQNLGRHNRKCRLLQLLSEHILTLLRKGDRALEEAKLSKKNQQKATEPMQQTQRLKVNVNHSASNVLSKV
jgi:hypothetical protein